MKRDWAAIQDCRRPISGVDLPEDAPQKAFLKRLEILKGTFIVKSHLLCKAHSLPKYMPGNPRFANGV
jgi:hypothetical protein